MRPKSPTHAKLTRQPTLKPVKFEIEFSDAPSLRVRNKRLRKLATVVVGSAMAGLTLHESGWTQVVKTD